MQTRDSGGGMCACKKRLFTQFDHMPMTFNNLKPPQKSLELWVEIQVIFFQVRGQFLRTEYLPRNTWYMRSMARAITFLILEYYLHNFDQLVVVVSAFKHRIKHENLNSHQNDADVSSSHTSWW